MSKILKPKQHSNVRIIIPDLDSINKEVFQSLLEINLEEFSKIKKKKKTLREKFKYEGFEEGFKEGINKGYLEGYKKGYKEGFEKGEKEAQERYKILEKSLEKNFKEKISIIEKFFKNLEKEIQEVILNLDKEILKLSFNIAEKMILKELQIDQGISLRVIKEALNYIAEGTEVNIKVNPEEYEFLKENILKYIIPPQRIKLIPDDSISKGGVFIETSLGIIDATFEKRWKKFLEELLTDEG